MRALFLTKHGRLGATTRYRALQYLPYLAANGWEVEWQPLLSDRYLEQLYHGGRRSVAEICGGYAKRLRYLATTDLGQFDVVWVQSEALPYVPSWLESWAIAGARNIVLDYDDAVFVPYEGSRLLRHKVARLMRPACEVIVGNENLRQYATQQSQRVSLIPTVIDLARYQPRTDYECRHPDGVVIGWVGTPVTARYLATLSGVFQRLAQKHAILVRFVGTPTDFRIPGVRVENIPWREETEAEVIRSFDVGVMPLADERFAHGKCGLKLVQYMACGVPSVGARLGANAEIVEHGVDGLLASGDQDYVEIIERLIADRGLRERIGRAGRKKVEERYSLQVQARVFRSVLERATRCPAKIVVVTTSPLALRAFFQSQVPFLVSRGFDVLAVSSPGPELHEFQAATGIPVRAVPMKRQISPVSDLVALWRMCSVLRQYRPTMVHAHTPKAGLLAMIAAWLTGVKLRLYTIHGLPLTTRSGWRFQLLRLAERLTCTLATEVHGVSPSVEQATTGLRICSKEKIRTLGHGSCAGVSLEKFDPAVYRQADRERIRARHGIPEAALVLGYIGRLAGDKGIRELAAAWRRLREEFPDLHLLCCGEFEPQDPVPAQAREMLQNDPRVHFSDGFVSEMPPVYAAIDVCVLPTYREGLPTVALESAAMEIPMVATRVTGCVDAIRDGVTGLLVEPRDPDALADAVSRLLRDPGLRKEMGRAAREFVAARFSEQRVFDLLLGEYRRLLAERGLQPLPCET